MDKPKTLQQAIQYFKDEQTCIDTIAELRWPNGPVCPNCGHGEHYYLATQKRWKCKKCSRQFSVKVGTILEDSPVSLGKWLIALWMLVNCRNGVSSYEVGRTVGITQKSAWFVMHRLRLALQVKSLLKLGGHGKEIEADESFIGGAARFMHVDKRKRIITGRGVRNKAAAFAILERGGEVRAFSIPNRRRHALQSAIVNHVEEGSQIFTDALKSYTGLRDKYQHEVVDHAYKYVRGRVHTNGLENFWSWFKRRLKGTHVSIEPFHLFRYLDEQAFRYNNRNTKERPMNDSDRFTRAMMQLAGKRLTWNQVTGKVADGRITCAN